MNEWILIAIFCIWVPVAGISLALCMFPGPIERLWKDQNRKEEDDHDLWI
jgi:hypothetical protein